MEELLEKIKVIFELDELDLSKKFTDYNEWDSLTSISIIALLDSDYNIRMTTEKLLQFSSLGDFCTFVVSNGK